jgi:hypothetical protein
VVPTCCAYVVVPHAIQLEIAGERRDRRRRRPLRARICCALRPADRAEQEIRTLRSRDITRDGAAGWIHLRKLIGSI